MTTIGTFTPAKDGFLQGKIKTLTLNLAKVTLEPVTSDHDSPPPSASSPTASNSGPPGPRRRRRAAGATTRSGSMIRASPPRCSPT
jgi:hypothetical protein